MLSPRAGSFYVLGQVGGQTGQKGSSSMTISEIDERNATGSLHGLRVLDFSTTIAGPHCTRMLADVGAEVIKIESADGEMMRIRPPVRNGCSSLFGPLNAGKKSLVLGLKSPPAIGIVPRLVNGGDILVG